jgi:hypothetical protein
MLLGQGKRPQASGFGVLDGPATAGCMLAAYNAVSEPEHGFWSLHGDEARRRCASSALDEIDVLGFLGADLFGPGALLQHAHANPRMQMQASKRGLHGGLRPHTRLRA